MSILAWAGLIILTFIFIFIGTALIVFFTFFFNDGASPGLGVAIFLLALLAIAVISPNYIASPILPASIIAVSFLVSLLGVIAHFLLPYFDNKDVIMAFRPLILFSIASGIIVAVFNLAKVLAV